MAPTAQVTNKPYVYRSIITVCFIQATRLHITISSTSCHINKLFILRYTDVRLILCVYILIVNMGLFILVFIQSASRETDVFEMDVTEQVEGVEAWVGGN